MLNLAHAAQWDDVRVFVAVMRTTSFRKAAKLLQIEQSTVSRRLAALERALGGALFDRTGVGPRPTELGLRLLPQAERMAAHWLSLIERSADTKQGMSGRVRLSVPSSFALHVVLPNVIPRLRAAYPLLNLDLVVDERQSDLALREADLAVRFVKPERGDLVAKRIVTLPSAIAANRKYAEGRVVTVPSLDWILFDLSPAPTLDSVFLSRFPKVTPVMRTTLHLAQIEAVRAGIGVALLAKPLLRSAPELTELKIDGLVLPEIPIWLVTPRSLAKTPRVRVVWVELERELRQLQET